MENNFDIESFLSLEDYATDVRVSRLAGANGKFSVTLMNPPYDKNLHLKFLEKVIQISDEVVSIQPIRWLQDPLAGDKKNSDYLKYEDSISKHITDLEEIKQKDAKNLFSIQLLQPLGIFTIKSNTTSNYYIDYFKNGVFEKIKIKILKENNIKYNNIVSYSDNLGGYYVCLNRMAPPMKYGKPMFYALKQIGVLTDEHSYRTAKQTLKGAVRGDVEKTECAVFKTRKEAQNCYDAFSTTFAKYVCSISVVDVHVHQKYLPWMKDYKEPWTNKRFCDYFNISGYISDNKAEPGSDWEEILNTMKQYQ